jgi:hypothetical protein
MTLKNEKNISSSETWSPQGSWRRFRIETEAAKHYHLSYSMYAGQTHRDKLLEMMLPTLLYIKAVTLLDDSLDLWLSQNNHILSKPYKNDLYGRIEYIADKNFLNDRIQLHQIRDRRNTLAHELMNYCTWEELDKGISIIENCLISFNLVQPTQKLEYFSERSAMESSTDPKVDFSRTFKYGIKEDGEIALEISWTQNFLKD